MIVDVMPARFSAEYGGLADSICALTLVRSVNGFIIQFFGCPIHNENPALMSDVERKELIKGCIPMPIVARKPRSY